MASMTRPLLAACLVLAALSPAYAAPPTEAQVDRLLETMDMRRTQAGMLEQIDRMGARMGEQMLGASATAAQRDALRRASSQQHQAMRTAMSWETLAPVYRKVYTQLFTAEEVDAMIAFYGSDTGRGILRKMPQAMERSMQEMQPIMQSLVSSMQATLDAEARRVQQDATPPSGD